MSVLASTRNVSPLALVLIAVTVLAGSTVQSARSSAAAASATVDGTWSCPVPALNGYRAIKVDTTRALGGISSASTMIADLLAGPDSFLAGIIAGPNPGNNLGRVFVSRRSWG